MATTALSSARAGHGRVGTWSLNFGLYWIDAQLRQHGDQDLADRLRALTAAAARPAAGLLQGAGLRGVIRRGNLRRRLPQIAEDLHRRRAMFLVELQQFVRHVTAVHLVVALRKARCTGRW